VIDRIFRGSAKVRTGAAVVARNPVLVVIPLLAAVTACFFLFDVLLFGILFRGNSLFYYLAGYLGLFPIVNFFRAALMCCCAQIFADKRPSVGAGCRHAASKLPELAAWSLFTAAGWVLIRQLKAIRGRTENSYFALPAIVLDGVRPTAALQRSTTLLRQTWGEAASGEDGTRYLVAVLMAPLLFAGKFNIAGQLLMMGYGVTMLAFAACLATIFKTAAYVYASTGKAPLTLTAEIFDDVFRARQRADRQGRPPFEKFLATALAILFGVGVFVFIALSPLILCRGGGAGGNCGEGLMVSLLVIAPLAIPLIVLAAIKLYRNII
jgi:Family of unknown function (DUF6159)